METARRRAHWQGIYAAKAEDEVSWYQETPRVSLDLIARAAFGQAARIVDVGGGASRLVDHLLERGFKNVTVLDVADAALATAKARLGPRAAQVGWVVADVTSWKAPGTFDIWHDRAVFHFLTDPEDRKAYRAVLGDALRLGGQLIVGTFALDGPERCSGLPVVRYGAASLGQELGPGYRLLDEVREDHRTPSGVVQKFQFSRFLRV